MKWDKILSNKTTLYVVGGLALLNLIGYIATENTEGALAMVVIGVLTAKFSKNMVVVFGTSLAATSLLVGVQHLSEVPRKQTKEGLAGRGGPYIPSEPSIKITAPEEEPEKAKKNVAARFDHVKNNEVAQQMLEFGTAQGTKFRPHSIAKMQVGSAEKILEKEDMEAPEPFQGEEDESVRDAPSRQPDHAALLEKAYDSLDRLAGAPGAVVGGAQDQRPALDESKKKVLEAMQNLGPAMDSANQIVDKLSNNPNISRLVGSIADMADAITKRVKDKKGGGGPAPAEEEEI